MTARIMKYLGVTTNIIVGILTLCVKSTFAQNVACRSDMQFCKDTNLCNGGTCTYSKRGEKDCRVDCINCPPHLTGNRCRDPKPTTKAINYCKHKKIRCVADKECTNGRSCDVEIINSTCSTVCVCTGELGKIKCFNGQCELKTGKCICDERWTGRSCDVRCSMMCKNGGECVATNEKQTCKCPAWCHGLQCEKCNVPICYPNKPCFNGMCVPSPNSDHETCKCERGWTNRYCDQTCYLGCMNGGSCHLNDRCVCLPGTTGDRCEETITTTTRKYSRSRHLYPSIVVVLLTLYLCLLTQ